jgi:hypothetical protein
MSLGGPYFYHKITRRSLALFGYLFSNIHVKRYVNDSEKIIKVPCAYGSPHRDHPAYASDTSLKQKENTRLRQVLPRMGFTLDSWSFDVSRKKNSIEKLTHANEGYGIYQLQKVPYDLTITLGILTDQLDDLYQILEQIFPWFDPKLIISTKMNEALDVNDDITIILNSADPNISYEGSFDEKKMIEATLNFTMKTYMYRNTVGSSESLNKTIQHVDVSLVPDLIETIEQKTFEIPIE